MRLNRISPKKQRFAVIAPEALAPTSCEGPGAPFGSRHVVLVAVLAPRDRNRFMPHSPGDPNTMPYHPALTISLFTATMLLVLVKPRGYHEAWWTMAGAGAMLALGLVTPRDALAVVVSAKSALLFLFALLLLSALLERSGFFEWAAMLAGQRSRGDSRTLFRNVFVLGAIITVTLSLDTTAVILTPIVLVLVLRLRQDPAPFVIMCALVANMGSLLLPVSNLTNLIFSNAFGLGFGHFALRMLIPQGVALAVTFWLLRWRFANELSMRFDPSELPEAPSVIEHRGYFRAALAVLGAVLVGYFIAPLAGFEPYVVGFVGALVLAAVGLVFGRIRPSFVTQISWGIFPFVAGLFIVVQGVENAGVASFATRWVAHLSHGPVVKILMTAGLTGAASNLMNNLPAALVAKSALVASRSDAAAQFGALLGADLGPNILPFGSLATMLVLDSARKKGADLHIGQFIKTGLWLTPIVLTAASLALALSLWAFN